MPERPTHPRNVLYTHKEIPGLLILVGFPAAFGRFGFVMQDGSGAHGSIKATMLDKFYQPAPDQPK